MLALFQKKIKPLPAHIAVSLIMLANAAENCAFVVCVTVIAATFCRIVIHDLEKRSADGSEDDVTEDDSGDSGDGEDTTM